MKERLDGEFDMKDLGAARRILGIDIVRNRAAGTLCLSQKNYIRKLLRVFGMDSAKQVSTPVAAHFKLRSSQEISEKGANYMKTVPYSSVVGSMMYAMLGTRPDLAYGMSLISRFMSKPEKTH